MGPTEEATEVPRPKMASLAWSDAEPEPLRQPWGSVWSTAAIVLLCSTVIAMGIAGWALLRSNTSSAPTTSQPPTVVASAPPPSGNTSTDSQFIAALSKAGIRVYDPARVISAARTVCAQRSSQTNYTKIIATAYNNADITDGLTASTLVSDAEEFYCPQLWDYESQYGE